MESLKACTACEICKEHAKKQLDILEDFKRRGDMEGYRLFKMSCNSFYGTLPGQCYLVPGAQCPHENIHHLGKTKDLV